MAVILAADNVKFVGNRICGEDDKLWDYYTDMKTTRIFRIITTEKKTRNPTRSFY